MLSWRCVVLGAEKGGATAEELGSRSSIEEPEKKSRKILVA